MKLIEVLPKIKALIESDSWFDDFAISGVGPILIDDLLPADKEADKLEELSLTEVIASDGGPPKRGICLVAWLDEGDQIAEIDEDVMELSTLMIAVRENYSINRAPALGGSGKQAIEVMQRIKTTLQGAVYEDGIGNPISYRGYAKIDPPESPGEIIYFLEYQVTTTE